MLTTFTEARKTWVLSQRADESAPVGRVEDFVINPDTGIFEAIWVQTLDGMKLLLPTDILRWRANELLIEDENELNSPADLPRIQQIQDKEIPILGAPVFCLKKKIGTVKNFSFDTLSPRILSLDVGRGFWIFSSETIIPRNRILKITPEGIFISDPTVKIKTEAPTKKTILETELTPEKPVTEIGTENR